MNAKTTFTEENRGPFYKPDDPRSAMEIQTHELRPVLAEFAALMEMKLRKNDHKSSWKELPVEALFKLLMLEIEEFRIAHEYLSIEEARGELIDCAAYCMILHDRLGMVKK